MRILYFGPESGTSLHRANALKRLGNNVVVFDADGQIPQSPLVRRIHQETGCLFLGSGYQTKLVEVVSKSDAEVLWVDHGRTVGAATVRAARERGMKTVILNVDDPFGYRDRLQWLLFKKTLREYDLVTVVREPNIADAKRLGARNVMKVWRSADEIAHRPVELKPEEAKQYETDVLFLGTWMVGRGTFLAELINQGLNVSIVGDRWHKAPEWKTLEKHWKRPGVYTDFEYSAWIQSAKICIGLLSFQNRDLHTTRTAEIPLIGSLFCAERTNEHLELYLDGVEAVFWDDAKECAARCKELLADPDRIKEISEAGQNRCIANKTLNEPVMASVLERLMAGPSS